MFVPIVPHTTVINKTIIYNDTVLPLKKTGNNLKVTSIGNVSESSLENCLEEIFKSNPNVIFNTIQYSKNNERVYFYTNQDITTKAYEERNFVNYEPITSRTEILEELKNVLLAPKNKDNDCTSLYDVLMILRRLYNEYNSVEKRYKDKIHDIVKEKLGKSSSVWYDGFDYNKNILHISFKKYERDSYDDIYFAKQNGDLYVVKSESCWKYEVLSALNSILSEMYDELLKYANCEGNHSSEEITAVNSNFNIRISKYSITLSDSEYSFKSQLELVAPRYEDSYQLKCNSGIVNEAFSGKEAEIFRRIFVKISDCPKWSQAMLYEIRQNQLAEEQKIEDENKYKEMRREKKLALAKKIFPFLKI